MNYRRKNYTVQDATAILLLHHGHAIIIIIIVIVSETVASSTTFLRSYSCLKEKPILNGPLIINHLLVVESLMEMIHSTHERLNTIYAKGPHILLQVGCSLIHLNEQVSSENDLNMVKQNLVQF